MTEEEDSLKICDRCGSSNYNIKDGYEFFNGFGDKVKMKLCWDCDFDILNGGDPFADIIDILENRRENRQIF